MFASAFGLFDLLKSDIFELICVQDAEDAMVDLREYDVPFHVRFAIDNDIRAGHWYNVASQVPTLKLVGLKFVCWGP